MNPTSNPTGVCDSWILGKEHERCAETCDKRQKTCVERFWPKTEYDFRVKVLPRLSNFNVTEECDVIKEGHWRGNPAVYTYQGSKTCFFHSPEIERCNIRDLDGGERRICCCGDFYLNSSNSALSESNSLPHEEFVEIWYVPYILIGTGACCLLCFVLIYCEIVDGKRQTSKEEEDLVKEIDILDGRDSQYTHENVGGSIIEHHDDDL